MTVYSLVTKRGYGGHQRVLWVSRPAEPHRHWPPVLGSRVVGSSCRPPVALGSGGLRCCWQWEPGGKGPGPSRAQELCPEGPGYPPEVPYRPFCPCSQAHTLGLAGPRAGVTLKFPPLVHGQGHWEVHPQLLWGCLCLCGVLGDPGQPQVQAGGARRPAPSVMCVQQSAVESGPEVPVAGEKAGSRGGPDGGGRGPGGRRAGASVSAWLCEGSVAPRPRGWGSS